MSLASSITPDTRIKGRANCNRHRRKRDRPSCNTVVGLEYQNLIAILLFLTIRPPPKETVKTVRPYSRVW